MKISSNYLAFFVISRFLYAALDPLVQVDPAEVDLKKDVGPSSYYASISNPPTIEPMASEIVPALSLKNLKGEVVSISSFNGETPLLLISGSISCPIYRTMIKQIEAIQAQYGAKIKVFIIYTLEAHPALDPSPYTENGSGQWTLAVNLNERILVRQPPSYEQRVLNAKAMAERFQLKNEKILIDEIENPFWNQFGKFPNSLFLIDSKGMVVFSEAWAGKSIDPESKKTKLELALENLLPMPRFEP